jgi:hypothetical protein
LQLAQQLSRAKHPAPAKQTSTYAAAGEERLPE